MINNTSATYKNRRVSNESILVESDDENDQIILNLMSQNLSSIPPQIALNKSLFVTTLILANNTIKTLDNLKYFTNLTSLQLDRNKLTNINNLPFLSKLTTLWLNNNNFKDLNSLLSILQQKTPNVEYLSLICNPLCPILSESKCDEQHHEEYRLTVIHYLPKLKFLDVNPITIKERIKCKRLNHFVDNDSLSHSDTISPRSPRRSHKTDNCIRYDVNGEIFRIYSYYKPIKLIGSGSYGVVCSAIDKRNNKRVAIKKCQNIFNDSNDTKDILREVKLMQHFTNYSHGMNHDICKIYDCVVPINNFTEIHVIMPFYDSNLLNIINSKNNKLFHTHFRYITYQMLRGLTFIHKFGVIHRDIKPENIMINSENCKVKIIDFGIARTLKEASYY
eukprot:471713_1